MDFTTIFSCALILSGVFAIGGLTLLYVMRVLRERPPEKADQRRASSGAEVDEDVAREKLEVAAATRGKARGSQNSKSESVRKESNVKNRKKGASGSSAGGKQLPQFGHPWLVATLKGHSGQVLDLDLSANGKYVVSCAEVRDSSTTLKISCKSAISNDDSSSSSSSSGSTAASANSSRTPSTSSLSSAGTRSKPRHNKSKSGAKSAGALRAAAAAVSVSSSSSSFELCTSSSSSPSPSSSLSTSPSNSSPPSPILGSTGKKRKSAGANTGASSSPVSSTASATAVSKGDSVPVLNAAAAGLTRRQRKNRRRDNSSSTAQHTDSGVSSGPCSRRSSSKGSAASSTMGGASSPAKEAQTRALYVDGTAPLKTYCQLNMPDCHLIEVLSRYVLSEDQLFHWGYPCEAGDKVIIYRNAGAKPAVRYDAAMALARAQHNNAKAGSAARFDVNAREFVPGAAVYDSTSSETSVSSLDSSASSSGHGSGNSSDDDAPASNKSAALQKRHGGGSSSSSEDTYNRRCSRCCSPFQTTSCEYVTADACHYHPLKVASSSGRHPCCGKGRDATGCETASVHVWSGLSTRLNGPYSDYLSTRTSSSVSRAGGGELGLAFAVDCEMCFTVAGLELAKVSVVALDGHLVYESFVRPENRVVDHNTQFSGIYSEDLTRPDVKSLDEVRADLLSFVAADTILIGHGLENDLRALKLVHKRVVDTAILFASDNQTRVSLRSLCQRLLQRDIQVDEHNPHEDARAAMELALLAIAHRRAVKTAAAAHAHCLLADGTLHPRHCAYYNFAHMQDNNVRMPVVQHQQVTLVPVPPPPQSVSQQNASGWYNHYAAGMFYATAPFAPYQQQLPPQHMRQFYPNQHNFPPLPNNNNNMSRQQHSPPPQQQHNQRAVHQQSPPQSNHHHQRR